MAEEDIKGSPLLDLPTQNEETMVGGRLARFRRNWKFNPWAYSIIKKGLGWKWKKDPKTIPRRRFIQISTPYLQEYVQELLEKKVIVRRSIRFQGQLFCVPRKNSSKKRVILDLSHLNKFIQCDRFKMLTTAQIRTLLPRGEYAISIDLTDAYWHVPIAHHCSRYLGFALGHKAYAFRAMPFGLNIAPRIFTKLVKAVVGQLRSKGIQIAAYLDDWLIWAKSPKECLEAGKKVILYLQSLGFKINYKKSRLTSQQKFEWLGLDWDLSAHKISLPKEKVKEIAKLV